MAGWSAFIVAARHPVSTTLIAHSLGARGPGRPAQAIQTAVGLGLHPDLVATPALASAPQPPATPHARHAGSHPSEPTTASRSGLVDDEPIADGIQPAGPRPGPMIDGAHAPKS